MGRIELQLLVLDQRLRMTADYNLSQQLRNECAREEGVEPILTTLLTFKLERVFKVSSDWLTCSFRRRHI